MCFSAKTEQNPRKIAKQFVAEIQTEMFEDLFRRRVAGEKLLINKAMERSFTLPPLSAANQSVATFIHNWHLQRVEDLRKQMSHQEQRLTKTQHLLAVRSTKKALDEERIAKSKIAKFQAEILSHQTQDILAEEEERIFPLHYVSLLCVNKLGQKVVCPMRYLMRPHDKGSDFDLRFNGCYNARLDNLQNVAWWKDSLEKRRGLLVVKKFYENVAADAYRQHHSLSLAQPRKNLVLCFEPASGEEMLVPTLWDFWKGRDGTTLLSTALITDEPAPEVAQAGHGRTPIFLQKEAVDEWLFSQNIATSLMALSKRERPYYRHHIINAA